MERLARALDVLPGRELAANLLDMPRESLDVERADRGRRRRHGDVRKRLDLARKGVHGRLPGELDEDSRLASHGHRTTTIAQRCVTIGNSCAVSWSALRHQHRRPAEPA